jgi:hypothetical protein
MHRQTRLNQLRDAIDNDEWARARELLARAKEDLRQDQQDIILLETLIPPESS